MNVVTWTRDLWTRNKLVVVIAAVVIVVLIAALIGVAASTAGSPSAPAADPGSSAIPTPTATSTTPAPTPSSTADATDPQAPATIDPYFGDVVVGAAPASGGAATFTSGLSVELVSVVNKTITGSGVGSTTGPAIEVTIRVTNTSGSAAQLTPVVNAYSGDERTPLTPDNSAGASDTALASSIPASGQSTGSYTFAVDDTSSTIWITVSTSPDSGLVVLQYDR